jgi:heat shock protein HslJ
MTLGEVAVPMLPGGRQPSIKLDPEQKKVTGYTGCNNFFGTYDLSGSALKFGPLAATRRACPEPASTVETKYLEALAGVRVWKIADGWLLLQNDGVILARFSNDTAAVSTPNLESLTLRASAYRKDPVTLTRGEYRAPAAPGSASEVVVRLTDNRLFGSLNGKETGAVVLTTSLGGTGTYYELALLFRKDDSWTHADSVPLGDRVKVHSVTIENARLSHRRNNFRCAINAWCP